MKPTLALLATLTLAASAAEPDAGKLLAQMSAKLAAARSYNFTAHREIAASLCAEGNLPEKARIAVNVQRPNHLAARAVTNHGTRRIVYNGRTLTVLDEKKNVYASVPMHTSLDGLVATLDDKYGFTPPLAEFVVSDPARRVRENARSVAYAGREKVGGVLGFGGVECDKLALKGREADAELWIAVSDGLPRKLVATFHRTGQPQVRVDFASWDLAAPATSFAFALPPGAQEIEMWTTARMQAAAKNR